MGKLLGRCQVSPCSTVRHHACLCWGLAAANLSAHNAADTAVTDVDAAEAQVLKLLPLQPWHRLLQPCSILQLRLAGHLKQIRPADVKTLGILYILSI